MTGWQKYYSYATAGFIGSEKVPINPALSAFHSRFYQQFTNISGELEQKMRELKKRIHDDKNGLDYVLCGDYYIPDDAKADVPSVQTVKKWEVWYWKSILSQPIKEQRSP